MIISRFFRSRCVQPTLANIRLRRTMSSSSNCTKGMATVLHYSKYGDPMEVLQQGQEPMPVPKDHEVLLKMLLSPINPADINTIQGKYPQKPALPAVPGHECLFEVLSIGSAVSANDTNLAVGDRCIPRVYETGTWRTHNCLPATALQRVPNDMDAVAAATLTVNPPSAYRMLRDFVCLEQGDTVIQNGGNSAVGQAVAQLCRIWGFNCVSVVRDRPDIDALRAFLVSLGATAVLTEAEVRHTQLFKNGLPRPKLALNCVGGKSSMEILRHLVDKGEMVTYGAMSKKPATAPNAALIFKDIASRGFWLLRWSREMAHSAERTRMFAELTDWYADGQLKAPLHELVEFSDWRDGLKRSMDFDGFTGKKIILKF